MKKVHFEETDNNNSTIRSHRLWLSQWQLFIVLPLWCCLMACNVACQLWLIVNIALMQTAIKITAVDFANIPEQTFSPFIINIPTDALLAQFASSYSLYRTSYVISLISFATFITGLSLSTLDICRLQHSLDNSLITLVWITLMIISCQCNWLEVTWLGFQYAGCTPFVYASMVQAGIIYSDQGLLVETLSITTALLTSITLVTPIALLIRRYLLQIVPKQDIITQIHAALTANSQQQHHRGDHDHHHHRA